MAADDVAADSPDSSPVDPPAPPRRYVVRRPSGDAAAARRLATAYDELADAVRAQSVVAAHVLDQLHELWRGEAARGADAPQRVLRRDGARVAAALDNCAEDLRGYAHRLQRAHDQHGWSIGRLVAMGAMVTVGVAAVVVTVGAAAPAEAAVAAAAVEGAEAATVAAETAGGAAMGGLESWEALLTTIRPLASFVVPHLVSAGAAVGFDTVSELLTAHRLDARSLEVSAAVGFAGSATGAVAEQRLASMPSVVRRLGEAGTWGSAGTVGRYVEDGDVDPADAAAYALTGVVARDVRAGTDEARLMWKLRVPQRPLGFASAREWRRFVTTLYAGLDEAGYRNVVVAFRESSDWDLALMDEESLSRSTTGGIGTAGAGTRSAPLNKTWQRELMGLAQVTDQLEKLASRPVTWTIYRDLVALQQRNAPHLLVPRP